MENFKNVIYYREDLKCKVKSSSFMQVYQVFTLVKVFYFDTEFSFHG